MVKLGAKSEFCASVSGFLDIFLTLMVVILPRASVCGLENVVVVSVVAVKLFEPESVLEVFGFE